MEQIGLRDQKLHSVLTNRQWNIAVLLENVHDLMNVSNIFRSCESAGIMNILVLNNSIPPHPFWGRISSKGAYKWLNIRQFVSTGACLEVVRSEFGKLLISSTCKESASLYNTDLTGSVVLAFGNEQKGITGELTAAADGSFHLPMYGMSQSLNVANAAAITAYEMLRQREAARLYGETTLADAEYQQWINQWSSRKKEALHIKSALVSDPVGINKKAGIPPAIKLTGNQSVPPQK